MKERKLTCIVCPKGCELTVTLDDGGRVEKIEGYTCKRGLEYANAECTHPVRTLTSTVRACDGGIYAVKTESAIPKELIFECMKCINETAAPADARIGDAVIDNVSGTGVRVLITSKKY